MPAPEKAEWSPKKGAAVVVHHLKSPNTELQSAGKVVGESRTGYSVEFDTPGGGTCTLHGVKTSRQGVRGLPYISKPSKASGAKPSGQGSDQAGQTTIEG